MALRVEELERQAQRLADDRVAVAQRAAPGGGGRLELRLAQVDGELDTLGAAVAVDANIKNSRRVQRLGGRPFRTQIDVHFELELTSVSNWI